MAVRNTERQHSGPDYEQLLRDTEVIVHRRSTREPIPFVSRLSIREGASALEILRGDEGDAAEHDPLHKSA